MSKNKSLFFQCTSAIDGCFSMHFDKHSSKHQKGQQPEQNWRIYSFASKSALYDTAHNLCQYIKENYPEIRKVKEIRMEQCQSWLNSKAKAGCTLCTVETYKSNLVKLSKVVNHYFGIHTNYETKVHAELVADRTSPREFALSDAEIDRVRASIVKPCHSSNFFLFSTYTSVRVNSVEKLLVSDLRYDKDENGENRVTVAIRNDKGSRDRTIIVTDERFYSFCRSLTDGKKGSDSLFGGIKKGSANRWLNRRLHRLGIIVPRDRTVGSNSVLKSGNHSIRKAAVQAYYRKQYQSYIDRGRSPADAQRQAAQDVCIRLGHNGRQDIINIYLKADS